MAKENKTQKLSREDVVKMKKIRMDHMADSMEMLELQDKYSNLKANIAENNLREHLSKLKLAQLLAGPEDKKTESDEGKEK